MYKILILDDEKNILNSLKRLLVNHTFNIRNVETKLHFDFFQNPYEALEQIKYQSYDVIISDYKMPIMDGSEFQKEVYELQPHSCRMILSGQADKKGIIKAINEGKIYKFLNKPWDNEELITNITEALEYKLELEEDKLLADENRLEHGKITEEEVILHTLEYEEPGITKVEYSPEGYIVLSDEDEENKKDKK